MFWETFEFARFEDGILDPVRLDAELERTPESAAELRMTSESFIYPRFGG